MASFFLQRAFQAATNLTVKGSLPKGQREEESSMTVDTTLLYSITVAQESAVLFAPWCIMFVVGVICGSCNESFPKTRNTEEERKDEKTTRCSTKRRHHRKETCLRPLLLVEGCLKKRIQRSLPSRPKLEKGLRRSPYRSKSSSLFSPSLRSSLFVLALSSQ